jgi:hypothetical protein
MQFILCNIILLYLNELLFRLLIFKSNNTNIVLKKLNYKTINMDNNSCNLNNRVDMEDKKKKKKLMYLQGCSKQEGRTFQLCSLQLDEKLKN